VNRPERIEDYLEHISEAASRAIRYLSEIKELSVFLQDQRNQDAVVRNIEIIGEAVAILQRVAPDFIASNPEVPWAKMRAMRNIVIHEYFFLDSKLVWSTVQGRFAQAERAN
jgi:uncharacterized protein with HEPN domain